MRILHPSLYYFNNQSVNFQKKGIDLNSISFLQLKKRSGYCKDLAALVALLIVSSCAHKSKLVYVHNNHDDLYDSTKTILFIPTKNIVTEYYDNTKIKPDTQFTDSFFLEALNGLVPYELSQHFQIFQSDFLGDSISKLFNSKVSFLKKRTDNFDSTSYYFYQLAKQIGVDFIAFPYSCSIKHRVVKPKGWREDKYGEGYYSRPVSYKAQTEFHIQIWNNKGDLLFERVGSNTTGRPILYSLFKKEQGDKDISQFARRFYAPPLVRSLYKSVAGSLVFRW